MKIGDIIRKALAEGKDTAAILALVKAEHPNAQTTSASVAWYKSQMKKVGNEAPKAPPAPKAAHQAVTKALPPVATDVGYTVGKYKPTQGIEGPGFIVTLYRDGKPVAEAADYGDGAPVFWTWFDKVPAKVKALTYSDEPHEYNGTQEEALFWTHCISLPKYLENFTGKPQEHHMTPDIFIEELVSDMELRKRYLRLKKGNVVYVKDGQVWTWKAKVPEHFPIIIKKIKEKDPLAIVLNNLPDDEAVKTFKGLVAQH